MTCSGRKKKFFFSFKDSYVSCVTEVPLEGSTVLAVGLQLSPAGGKICLIAVHGSALLGSIDLVDKVTSCCVVPHSLRTVLQLFDGCLAVGTDQGRVFVLDLCLKQIRQIFSRTLTPLQHLKVAECHIVDGGMEPNEIAQHHLQSKRDGIYFGVQLEALDDSEIVLSLLVIPLSQTLIIGLDDGRMILYNLESLQPFHLAYPPEKHAPLMHLSFVEPADDPRACIYVWALHASPQGAIGVLHSVMFERKYADRQIGPIYNTFLSCSARLTMPFYDVGSFPISCRAISKVIDEEEELKLTLFSVVWATSEKTANLMIFDLNQWYKEQMPELGDWRQFPSYIAAFPLGEPVPLDIFVDERRVVPFNSTQRPEEHFYPNSLCFDVEILNFSTTINATWPGLQNKVLFNFKSAGSAAILNPAAFLREMNAAALTPQFHEFYTSALVSLDQQREFLLSVALEYNCIAFLKKIAVDIADGSHIGNVPTEALGLSTVCDWLWERAQSLKEISNDYSVPLFDYSGRNVDANIRKSLSHCTRQLRALADIYEVVCTQCADHIPESIMKLLLTQRESVQLAADYQEALQWLLNVGILPESQRELVATDEDDSQLIVPFPFEAIAEFYVKLRMKLRDRGSKYVYIDQFIENACDADAIHALWRENGDSECYPPASLQKMLRVLLLPNFSLESKHILFIYLFMDINFALSKGR